MVSKLCILAAGYVYGMLLYLLQQTGVVLTQCYQ
jgi:hypothetical protein